MESGFATRFPNPSEGKTFANPPPLKTPTGFRNQAQGFQILARDQVRQTARSV